MLACGCFILVLWMSGERGAGCIRLFFFLLLSFCVGIKRLCLVNNTQRVHATTRISFIKNMINMIADRQPLLLSLTSSVSIRTVHEEYKKSLKKKPHLWIKFRTSGLQLARLTVFCAAVFVVRQDILKEGRC